MSAVVGILFVGVTGGLRCVNFTNTVLMHVQNVRVFCIAHYCTVLEYVPWRIHILYVLSGCAHKKSKCYFPSFLKRLRDFLKNILPKERKPQNRSI
jgi:hypothetical protein